MKMSKEEQLKWLQEHRVDIHSIEEMDKLEELDLGEWDLVEKKDFNEMPDFQLPALKKLNLSYNVLTSIPTFNGMPELKKLNISHIPELVGMKMSKEEQLKWLQEHRVDIHSIEEMDKMEALDLHGRCSGDFKLPDFQLPSLQALNLSWNGPTSVPDFSGLPELRELNISYDRLESVPDFSGMLKLVKLDISANSLTSVPDFSGLPALRELDVSFNSLQSIPDFSGLPTLRELDISFNYCLNSIPDFQWLPKLVNLLK